MGIGMMTHRVVSKSACLQFRDDISKDVGLDTFAVAGSGPEDMAKTTTMEAVLNRLKEHDIDDDYDERRKLWLRVKVGVNHWYAHEGMASATRLDESLTLWSILSRKDDTSDEADPEALGNGKFVVLLLWQTPFPHS